MYVHHVHILHVVCICTVSVEKFEGVINFVVFAEPQFHKI